MSQVLDTERAASGIDFDACYFTVWVYCYGPVVAGAGIVVGADGIGQSGFEGSREADTGVAAQGTDLEHVAGGGEGGEQGEEFALGGRDGDFGDSVRGAVAVGVGEAGVRAEEVGFGVCVDCGGEVDVGDGHGC